MRREFTYTKDRLRFIVESLLDEDVRRSPVYSVPDRAEEGFEKRAALEFLLWFLEEAFPEGFSFQCAFDQLAEDYGPELAAIIADGGGWASRHVREKESAGNVVFVDFSEK